MTNAELLAKIKAEIERQKTINKSLLEGQLKDGCLYAFNQVLSFLSTLESEKPMNLEEEINLWISENENIHHGDKLMVWLLKDVARYFAEWGYLRAAEKYNEIEYNRQRAEESVPNDLEEAAKHHSEQYRPHWPNQVRPAYDSFITGAKWQREQMMKEAVEGEVIVPIYEGYADWSVEVKIPGRYEIGDKVRIIIVKE